MDKIWTNMNCSQSLHIVITLRDVILNFIDSYKQENSSTVHNIIINIESTLTDLNDDHFHYFINLLVHQLIIIIMDMYNLNYHFLP